MNWDDTAPVLTGNPELDQLTGGCFSGGWQRSDLNMMCAKDKELLDEFFSKQIIGTSQNTSANIGVFCRNGDKMGYYKSCPYKERIIECGEDILKLDVVETNNNEILILSECEISIFSLRLLVRKMVRDFGVGIVFVEDIQKFFFPQNINIKFRDFEGQQCSKIRCFKQLALETNIPIVIGLDDLSVVENRNSKLRYDCDVIGVLTNEYNTETSEYSHVLELVKHRSGPTGKVNF